MSEGVVYLISGGRHWAVLVTSVMTLRDWYSGPVSVIATDDKGREIAKKISSDRRLQVEAVEMPHGKVKRNAGYANKTRLWEYSPFHSTVFLDADTTIQGPVDELFSQCDEMVLTGWGGWVSQGKMMAGRIRKWEKQCPEMVQRMIASPWPAINTGVFGFTKDTLMVRDWWDVTKRNVCFICDEIAAQLMYPDYPVRLLTDRWNCSPWCGQTKADKANVLHYHGRKHLRDGNREHWYPHYQKAVDGNYAGIADWTPGGDTRLAAYLEDVAR